MITEKQRFIQSCAEMISEGQPLTKESIIKLYKYVQEDIRKYEEMRAGLNESLEKLEKNFRDIFNVR